MQSCERNDAPSVNLPRSYLDAGVVVYATFDMCQVDRRVAWCKRNSCVSTYDASMPRKAYSASGRRGQRHGQSVGAG